MQSVRMVWGVPGAGVSVVVDLSALNGTVPVAVRYVSQSGGPNCCDDG